VVAFYLMRDWDRMVEALLDLIPRPWQEHVSLMVAEADDVLGAFIRGQFLVMLAQAIMYSTLLWLVGIDYAVILGTLAGVAAIIPYAGSVIGIGSSIAVAWTQFGGDLSPLLWVSGVFALGQTIESWVLTPMLVGDRIGLHPVVVIFVLMAGGQLAGFTGVLVALPVAAVIFVFGRHALTYYRHSRTYQGS
jgi:predicted PurR-regulated permease PerM